MQLLFFVSSSFSLFLFPLFTAAAYTPFLPYGNAPFELPLPTIILIPTFDHVFLNSPFSSCINMYKQNLLQHLVGNYPLPLKNNHSPQQTPQRLPYPYPII